MVLIWVYAHFVVFPNRQFPVILFPGINNYKYELPTVLLETSETIFKQCAENSQQ